MNALLQTFGEVFNAWDNYAANRPSEDYLRRLLGSDTFIALAALKKGVVVGGLAAYELKKFEQERSVIHLYDLAVKATPRRQGIATALLKNTESDRRGAQRSYHHRAGRYRPPG